MIEQLKVANAALVSALDRIHDVLNMVYVDDIALIVNNDLDENRKALAQPKAQECEHDWKDIRNERIASLRESVLLPCPFCGSADIANVSAGFAGPTNHFHAGDPIFAVNCRKCGGSVPNRYQNKLVVEAWNTRAALTQPKAQEPANQYGPYVFQNACIAGSGGGGTNQPKAQETDYKTLYNELLYAVVRVHPDETRHQTALRYIRLMEAGLVMGGIAASPKEKP
jgi:Lar family restriction alleviation protein